ncbi:MAG: ABC transporter ATP-binding protein [Anaerolineae bacterium]|nr:ABC transporter ATP-binding protein [Anaerolineae bacterium]
MRDARQASALRMARCTPHPMQPATSSNPLAVEMRGITKRFGALVANDRVDFRLRRGQIHALLGENGAGKTTLMRILYGLYHADEGEIRVDGRPAAIRSPKDAIALGIGMVTQHFALVPPLTVAENVVLGYNPGVRLNLAAASQKVAEAAARLGIEVDPRALVKDLSVGERQRVEILKALYRNANVLILDEPTAVLVPQEVDQLFASLRRLQEHGLSVVFISHKLYEVMAITDQVTVLRGGQVVGTVNTAETTQAELARMMVGRSLAPVERTVPSLATGSAARSPLLRLEGVSAVDNKGLPALKGVSLEVHSGEIVGLAGVSGNGQTELAQVLEGVRRPTAGRILVDGQDLTHADPAQVMQAGVGRIPEDRHASLVLDFTVAQNLALEHLDEYVVGGGRLDKGRMRQHAEQLIAEYQIKARPDDRVRTLSGGNMQKVILARVLERRPKVLVAAQPTRGLDVGATEYVRGKLLEQRERGAAILLISEDLDEILELADRIAVIYEGEIRGVLPRREATPERLGLLMSGARQEQL